MQLTLKQYQTIKLITTFVLAIVIGIMVALKNFFIPIMLVAVSSLLLMQLRKKVKGVLADERDYELGGKAALLTMQIWSWTAVILMFAFLAFSDKNPFYTIIAQVLSFSVCYFMILYSLIFKYFAGKK
jgi:uncharacterized membrane protein